MPENGGLDLSNWKCWIEVELVNLSSLGAQFLRAFFFLHFSLLCSRND